MGVLAIMDRSGDTRVEWEKSDAASVGAARMAWDKALGQGYAGFKHDSSGVGTSISEFDETADKIVMIPPVVGG